MEELKKTLFGVACIVIVITGGFVAYAGNQWAHKVPDSEKAAIQICGDALRDKSQHYQRKVCLDAGLITWSQYNSAL